MVPIRRCQIAGTLALFACLLGFAPLSAAEIDLPRPGDREFVLDEALVIVDSDEEAIRATCDQLLTDQAIPIIVVTIDRMADHSDRPHTIETFAQALFDQWGIGHAKLGEQDWNTGILLVVAVEDRKARIELGAGWEREADRTCQAIMDERLVPAFKRDAYSDGIVAGVMALEAMARGKELPAVPRPAWHYLLIVGFIGLAIFTAVSLFRRGSSGWAWLFWGLVFSLVGTLLYHLLTSRSSGGGGFGGGSFGGGFSGGGGASGSW